MTNLEASPQQEVCPPADSTENTGPCVQLWPQRQVPLGGVRAMNVQRTLPQRGLPTIGAWCFLDSFGPDRTAMSVLPHPHIGLQTVTWPLEGRIRHRDSVGSDVVVRPGELNIMTAGRGVSHSEFALIPAGGSLPVQRGLQLWVALPDGERHREPAFEQHRDLPAVSGEGFRATVMVGRFAGATSPATMYSPIMGADISCAGHVVFPLDADFEHGILVLDGGLTVDGQAVPPGPLAYLGKGRRELEVQAMPGTRFLLIGGEPFQEELLMWWNFVARTHEEVELARDDWEAQAVLANSGGPSATPTDAGAVHPLTVHPGPAQSGTVQPGTAHPGAAEARYGVVAGHGPDAGAEAGRIPAPPLPGVRLTPRKRL